MFTFAQISDFHITTSKGLISQLRTDDHLRVMVSHLNNLGETPAFVLCTGDLVDTGGAEEYDLLAEILSNLRMPYYFIPGNHDEREAMRQAFPNHGYLSGHDGFMQYEIEDYEPRLIGLDTLVPGESGGRLCQRRISWLQDRLAEQPSRPTILFMHHPPFRTGIFRMDKMGLEDPSGFAAVIAQNLQIEAILSGHLHRPISRKFANTIAMTAPATAHQIELDLTGEDRLALIMEPPAALLHLWLGGDDGLVSHVSYSGGCYERQEVYAEGKRNWIKTEKPPTLSIPI